MRAIFCRALIFFLALPACTARAGDVAVIGRLGYMSEWEVAATARATGTGRQSEFAGPLVIKHIGACSPGGAVEKSGEIRFRRTGLLTAKIEGTLAFGDEQCTFEAREATSEGIMKCPGKGGVPLSLKIGTAAN